MHSRLMRGVPLRQVAIKPACVLEEAAERRRARGVPPRNVPVLVFGRRRVAQPFVHGV